MFNITCAIQNCNYFISKPSFLRLYKPPCRNMIAPTPTTRRNKKEMKSKTRTKWTYKNIQKEYRHYQYPQYFSRCRIHEQTNQGYCPCEEYDSVGVRFKVIVFFSQSFTGKIAWLNVILLLHLHVIRIIRCQPSAIDSR